MKGEKESEVSLKEFFNQRFTDLKELVDTRFKSVEDATTLLAENTKIKFEGVNEWRAQSKDREAQFLTQLEHKAAISSILSDIRILREARAEETGKASQKSVNVLYVFSIVSLLFGLIGTIISIINLFAK